MFNVYPSEIVFVPSALWLTCVEPLNNVNVELNPIDRYGSLSLLRDATVVPSIVTVAPTPKSSKWYWLPLINWSLYVIVDLFVSTFVAVSVIVSRNVYPCRV